MRILTVVILTLLMTSSAVLAEDLRSPLAELVYVTEEYKPHNFTNQGRLTGMAVETLRLIWRDQRIDEQPIQVAPWSRGYDLLKNDRNIVLFSTVRTPEREKLFKWVGPISQTTIVLLTLANRPVKMSSLNDAHGKRVAVVKDTSGWSLLQDIKMKADDLVEVHSIKSGVRMLENQRVDLFAVGFSQFLDACSAFDCSMRLFKVAWHFHDRETYFALNRDVPDNIVVLFQEALDRVKKTPAYRSLQLTFQPADKQ